MEVPQNCLSHNTPANGIRVNFVRAQFSHVFRDVFMGRLVILVKRSHLRSCTLHHGTAAGNPNCGQRVADDNAPVPKSIFLVS